MQCSSSVIDNVIITNPKLSTDSQLIQDSRIFPYYAGYSSQFSNNIIESLNLPAAAVVFDPWNGSGTTTQSALRYGKSAIGFDLNPVMVIVAKARLLSYLELPSLFALAKSLFAQIDERPYRSLSTDHDPLLTWFTPSSTRYLRALERQINGAFVNNEQHLKLDSNASLDRLSPLGSFFYVALFRTVRRLAADFIPSNPTWVKAPKSKQHRKRPSKDLILYLYLDEIQKFILQEATAKPLVQLPEADVQLKIGNAEKIALGDDSVDAVISSPPYCTRIDYAVATSIELATLGYGLEEFDELRRSLTGTSTVSKHVGPTDERWGSTCTTFLNKVYEHPSRASKVYYFKNHVQYFSALSSSLGEIARVLKRDGVCIIVAQDSHYKEIHNDVPAITVEMAAHWGMHLVRKVDFDISRSMVRVNLKSKKYLSHRRTTESVLCFVNS